MPIYPRATWRKRYSIKWIKTDVWWRYIDDMFIIWTYGEECFVEFVNQINNMNSKIQFTAEWSTRSVAFLDVKVNIDKVYAVRVFFGHSIFNLSQKMKIKKISTFFRCSFCNVNNKIKNRRFFPIFLM